MPRLRLLRLGQTVVLLGDWGAKISPSSQLGSSDPLDPILRIDVQIYVPALRAIHEARLFFLSRL
jgi:hypothetical protein